MCVCVCACVRACVRAYVCMYVPSMGLSLQTSWLDPRRRNELASFYGCRFLIPVCRRSLGESNSCVFSAANAFSSVFQN